MSSTLPLIDLCGSEPWLQSLLTPVFTQLFLSKKAAVRKYVEAFRSAVPSRFYGENEAKLDKSSLKNVLSLSTS